MEGSMEGSMESSMEGLKERFNECMKNQCAQGCAHTLMQARVITLFVVDLVRTDRLAVQRVLRSEAETIEQPSRASHHSIARKCVWEAALERLATG